MSTLSSSLSESSGAMAYRVLLLLLSLLLLYSPATGSGEHELLSTYVVHVSSAHKPAGVVSHRRWHSLLLRSAAGSGGRILYSYTRAASGFAAALSPSAASALASHPAVVSLVPDSLRRLHTTRTPEFLRLSDGSGIWPASNYADGAIVGVLDTGVWPISRSSFSDHGLPPPPSTWRGRCESGGGFNATVFCNNKIIGARAFYKGYEAAAAGRPIDWTKESKPPLDTNGHGTHTASTAAGAAVDGAGFYSYARGTARGMATSARIAVYKICWAPGCFDSDILAAMDAAVADGVNIISLSVGASFPSRYYRDSIAIGAFGAAKHGVLVSCSAGNSGPGAGTAVNVAPWILTVGASTLDREFPADVKLGNGSVLPGVSLYAGDPLNASAYYPLAHGADCGSRFCVTGKLDSTKTAGKIVVCDRGGNSRVEKGSAVKLAGGIGVVVANTAENGEELLADSHLIPGTMVGERAGNVIRAYINSDASPAATIVFHGTVISTSPDSPRVASFSSRGPSYPSPQILKPDIIAPGVNILAAWTGYEAPTELEIDPRRVEFNIISGTSMSCPHASGISALLCRAHPDWSPAAIKSALITTAYNTDNAGEIIYDLATGEASTPLVRGAGHVDPNRALDPGLVYDATADDYLAFMCSLGYTGQQVAVFTRDGTSMNCSTKALRNPGDLNYPSFSVVFDSNHSAITYTRAVRNVGSLSKAVYNVKISNPAGVDISIEPSRLEFDADHLSLSYTITFTSVLAASQSFGSVAWTDGTHIVQSPIAVSWPRGLVSSI